MTTEERGLLGHNSIDFNIQQIIDDLEMFFAYEMGGPRWKVPLYPRNRIYGVFEKEMKAAHRGSGLEELQNKIREMDNKLEEELKESRGLREEKKRNKKKVKLYCEEEFISTKKE